LTTATRRGIGSHSEGRRVKPAGAVDALVNVILLVQHLQHELTSEILAFVGLLAVLFCIFLGR
jgi:hypothetical protein